MNTDYDNWHRFDVELGIVNGRVVVDGVDIAKTANEIRIDAKVGEVPTVVVRMPVPGISVEADGRVQVDGATRDALLLLGWTPPPVPLPSVSTVNGKPYMSRRSAEILTDMGWTPPADSLDQPTAR